ncbi:MFS transporter [Pseudooceanicola sediminis]|uniref:MFS transporter n=1 Tax=Pseudooceanicola sediminis TaxID=2211117 RepID=A0A399JA92_9RHOB|nr:MFS transporter [Pseudooceanicola sediminis]KAA2317212.1 MFS transporter [Puniceibacterium sp. HSS470]RII39566.1 MFS transporter [Pseudooceanicola sediminis]|tara:strand:+ start:10872 stop:12347 length:1476 start_codon:yes stop_codon:yes gene_type:complete
MTDFEQTPPAGRTRLRFLERGTPRLLAAAMMALFVAALDQTIVGPVLADILADFGGGALLAWVATGFLMASMVAAPLYGAIADIRGRRYALLLANALFLAGSILCAIAPSLEFLVAARLLQGCGAGGLVSVPFVVVADRVPMARRAVFSAFISTIYAVAGLIGPLAGGALAQYLSWRWVFWVNLLPCLLVFWGVMTALTPRAALKGRRIDWPGAGLLLAATVPLLLIFSASETVGAGETPVLPIWALVALSAVFWAGFAVRMIKARDPLIPLAVFTNRSIVLASLGLAACVGTNLGLAIYLPLYFQKVNGLSAAQAGLGILAMIAGGLVGAFLTPQILKRRPAYKRLVVSGAVMGTVFAAAVTVVMAQDTTLLLLILPTIGLGMGVGMLFPVFALIVQNAAAPGQMGASIGVLSFMRSMGGTIGVSVVGMMAVGSGLAAETLEGARLPLWSFGATLGGLMTLCLIAMVLLPNRRLEGYGRDTPPPVSEPVA